MVFCEFYSLFYTIHYFILYYFMRVYIRKKSLKGLIDALRSRFQIKISSLSYPFTKAIQVIKKLNALRYLILLRYFASTSYQKLNLRKFYSSFWCILMPKLFYFLATCHNHVQYCLIDYYQLFVILIKLIENKRQWDSWKC